MVAMDTEIERVASETSGASSMVAEEASVGSDAEQQQQRKQWAAARSTSVIEAANSVTTDELKELKQWFQVVARARFYLAPVRVARACVT